MLCWPPPTLSFRRQRKPQDESLQSAHHFCFNRKAYVMLYSTPTTEKEVPKPRQTSLCCQKVFHREGSGKPKDDSLEASAYVHACVLMSYPPSTQQKPCQFLRPNLIFESLHVNMRSTSKLVFLKTPCKNTCRVFVFQTPCVTHVEFQFSIDMSAHVQFMFHRSYDCFSVHWRRHLLKILFGPAGCSRFEPALTGPFLTLALGLVQGSHVGSRMVSRLSQAALSSRVRDLEFRLEVLEEKVELWESGAGLPCSLTDTIAEIQLSLWALRDHLAALEKLPACSIPCKPCGKW